MEGIWKGKEREITSTKCRLVLACDSMLPLSLTMTNNKQTLVISILLSFVFVSGTFWLFAGITVIGVVFMFFMLPETKDKTLEEMEQLFMTSRALKNLAASRGKGEAEDADVNT